MHASEKPNIDIKYAIIFTNYFTTAKVITLKYVVLQPLVQPVTMTLSFSLLCFRETKERNLRKRKTSSKTLINVELGY